MATYSTIPLPNSIKTVGDISARSGQFGQLVQVPDQLANINHITNFNDLYHKYYINARTAGTTFTMGVIGTDISIGYDCYLQNSGTGPLYVVDSGANNIINVHPFNSVHLVAQTGPNGWYIDYQRDHSPYVVDGFGGTGYTTIQSAIDDIKADAIAGTQVSAVIYVRIGTYNENLTINDTGSPPYSVAIIGITPDGRTQQVQINGTVSVDMTPGTSYAVFENVSITSPNGSDCLTAVNGITALFNTAISTSVNTDTAIIINPRVGSPFTLVRLQECNVNINGDNTWQAVEVFQAQGLLSTTGGNINGSLIGNTGGGMQIINCGMFTNIQLNDASGGAFIANTISGNVSFNATYSGGTTFLGGALDNGTLNVNSTNGNLLIQASNAANLAVNINTAGTNIRFLNSEVASSGTINIIAGSIYAQGSTLGNFAIFNSADLTVNQSTFNNLTVDAAGTGDSIANIRQSGFNDLTVGAASTGSTLVEMYDSSCDNIIDVANSTINLFSGRSNSIASAANMNMHAHFVNNTYTSSGGNKIFSSVYIGGDANISNTNGYMTSTSINNNFNLSGGTFNVYKTNVINTTTFDTGTYICRNCSFNSINAQNNTTTTIYNSDNISTTQIADTSILNIYNSFINNISHSTASNIIINNTTFGILDQNGAGTINLYGCIGTQVNNNVGNCNIYNCSLDSSSDAVNATINVSGTVEAYGNILLSGNGRWANGVGTISQRANILRSDADANSVGTIIGSDLSVIGAPTSVNVDTIRLS